MRIPTSSRQTTADNTDADRTTTTVAAHRDDRPPISPRRDDTSTTTTIPPVRTETERAATVTADRPVQERHGGRAAVPSTSPAPKARASFIATLGLILGVAGALLVLSGPLLGYGMGVAGLALVLSVAGLFSTRKRHVAGKTDALIGLLLSIAALVVGVLALTGQLNWAGTDVQPVSSLREWLDAQFANRF
ncbi:hypothetical protein AB0M02_03175 [Actinoplanes sp. NPDC051861]|uniref:hypothetical protein n=1 Tax=Actinoplanes sp. NPDC051861 TaxID=3155170 RepID=UPI003434A8F4